MQENSEQKSQQTVQAKSCRQTDKFDRRAALAKLGKLAVYTTPVMTTLTLSKKAQAQLGSNPPPPPTRAPFPPGRPGSPP